MTELQQLDHNDDADALFDSQYLRWFHLQGKEVGVTIESVEKDVEMTLPGGVKSKRPIVRFKGKDKPLVLNSTNREKLKELLGRRPSEWVGKRIVLYPTVTQLKGKTVGCIRIKPVMAKATSSGQSRK